MPDTFQPPTNPGFPVQLPPREFTVRDPFEAGYVSSRAALSRPVRRWRLLWNPADRATVRYLRAFWRRQRGPATAFNWLLPTEDLYEPYPAVPPTASDVAGGALALRTYDVAVAWGNAAGETQVSPITTRQIAANRLVTVAVGEDFPTDATFFAVYAAVTGGALTRQGQVSTSGGTFTEPASGLVAGAAPSTVNAMSATVRVAFEEDELPVALRQAGVGELRLTLVERFTG